MALTNIDRKVIHTGNGSAVVFPYGFPVLDAAHLSVIYTDATGAETTLAPSLYGVSGIGASAGGSVTYPLAGSPIGPGTKLTIVRTVPYTQTTVLSNQGGYYPEVVERRFDEIYMALQQIAEVVGRNTVSSISDPATEQTNYGLIQSLQTSLGDMHRLTSAGDLLTRDGSGYRRLPRGTTGQFLGISGADVAWQVPSYPIYSGVRQTVSGGPITSAGLPNFLPATTSGTLTVQTQNVSSSYPLAATAATGWSSATGAPLDSVGVATGNLTWPALIAGRAATTPNFLYLAIAAGVLTPASTVLAPIYQWAGTPSTAAGQFTFNISEMRGYLGNGSSAPPATLVFVGEAATDTTSVISTIAYAYNGKFESGFTPTLPGVATTVSASHGIGIIPCHSDFVIECTAADRGYSIGDQLTKQSIGIYDGVNVAPLAMFKTSRSIAVTSGASQAFHAVTKATGVLEGVLTLSKWKFKFTAGRGW